MWHTSEAAHKLITEKNNKTDLIFFPSLRHPSIMYRHSVIKENDFSNRGNDIRRGMNLLYEANRSNLRSIAIYNNYGSLIAAEPIALQKEDPNVTRQGWYEKAISEMENMHFSTPHIQNLFDDNSRRYYWVISLSRVVELSGNGIPSTGVLIVDMDYAGISRMMKKINTLNNGQYFYLCDNSGEIIYHNRTYMPDSHDRRDPPGTALFSGDALYGALAEACRAWPPKKADILKRSSQLPLRGE